MKNSKRAIKARREKKKRDYFKKVKTSRYRGKRATSTKNRVANKIRNPECFYQVDISDEDYPELFEEDWTREYPKGFFNRCDCVHGHCAECFPDHPDIEDSDDDRDACYLCGVDRDCMKCAPWEWL